MGGGVKDLAPQMFNTARASSSQRQQWPIHMWPVTQSGDTTLYEPDLFCMSFVPFPPFPPFPALRNFFSGTQNGKDSSEPRCVANMSAWEKISFGPPARNWPKKEVWPHRERRGQRGTWDVSGFGCSPGALGRTLCKETPV